MTPSHRNNFLLLVFVLGFAAWNGCQDAGSADFEKELMDADRRFAREVAAGGPEDRGRIWARWFSPSGRQILPGSVVTGPASIATLMEGAFTSPGYELTWAPDVASWSDDGTLGWTSGRYESRRGSGDGVVEHGRYLTIWRRQADGHWKVELDTGVPDPEQ